MSALRDIFTTGCAPDTPTATSYSSSSSSSLVHQNPISNFFHSAIDARETQQALEEVKVPVSEETHEHLIQRPGLHRGEDEAFVENYMHSINQDGDEAALAELEAQQFGSLEQQEELFKNFNWDSFWQDFRSPNPLDAGMAETRAYEFHADNPFRTSELPFSEGMQLFHRGKLQEAILAFEEQIQRNSPDVNLSDVWRWLGSAHAENDEDKIAITCLLNSVSADPENLEALLDIGVSYTNELVAVQALNYLLSWLRQHPDYQSIPAEFPEGEEGFYSLHKRVTAMFHRAAEVSPNDSDVYAVLGVLYNLSREYDQAIESFKKAISLEPKNYSLWNKLGATQANSPRQQGSKEAVYAYRQALQLKPNYVRAWVNMGISYANQSIYDTASKYYLRALSLNPNAEHIWSYLRISLSCMNREDLVQLVDRPDRNPDLFRSFFEF